jgi:hypothetical protein
MQLKHLIISILPAIVLAGGPQVCKVNRDGSGESDYRVTKDCCAAAGGRGAYFNEVYDVCWPKAGPAGNSVDTGGMVRCCNSRGRGSMECRGTINC